MRHEVTDLLARSTVSKRCVSQSNYAQTYLTKQNTIFLLSVVFSGGNISFLCENMFMSTKYAYLLVSVLLLIIVMCYTYTDQWLCMHVRASLEIKAFNNKYVFFYFLTTSEGSKKLDQISLIEILKINKKLERTKRHACL